MSEQELKRLLHDFRSGELSEEALLERLRQLPFESLGYATIDHHRGLRQGFPEVILCEGKTPEQVVEIARRIHASGGTLLATRATPETFEALQVAIPEASYHPQARVITVGTPEVPSTSGLALVVSAGTADLEVAEEAAVTLEATGHRVERLYDVGVAGLHRLLGHRAMLEEADVIVVVAGMEGALPSVVGGLVDKPVIAVPTSVGYGASFQGLTALLAMLNSCAAGVTVVNIDNGFGAGFAAHMILRLAYRRSQSTSV